MGFQLPKELPRISQFTSLLASLETQFESMVRGATEAEVPPGPQSMLLKIQRILEAGEERPKISIPSLPPLPPEDEEEEVLEEGEVPPAKGEVAEETQREEGVYAMLRVKKGIHGEAI